MVKVGDKYNVCCFTSMGTDRVQEVTELKTQYDPETGVPFVIVCFEDHEFNSKTACAITSPTMYYYEKV